MQTEPTNLLDAIIKGLQTALGAGPLSTFVVTAIASFCIATATVLAIRSALKKEWASIGDWMDRIVVVVSPAHVDNNKLDRCQLGAMSLMRGKLLLEWPDSTAQALAAGNADLSRVVSRGMRLSKATEALTSTLTFVTAFSIQSLITGLMVVLEWPRMNEPTYVFALFLVFLWPGSLYLFQHSTLPDWRSDLDRTEANMKKLGRQFDFAAIELPK